MCQDRVMWKRLERLINVVCVVKVPTMSSLLGISEPEPGVPRQRDTVVLEHVINVVFVLTFQSLNRVCQDSETRERL
jgi:hypothetical protein